MNEIVIFRNNDKTVSLTVKRADGTAFNLAGCTVTMLVKKDIDDLDAEAVITKTGNIVEAANGIVEFYIEPDDTNDATDLKDNVTYPVDFEVETGTGKLYTVLRTSFVILKK